MQVSLVDVKEKSSGSSSQHSGFIATEIKSQKAFINPSRTVSAGSTRPLN
jgi:hypothetical protein